VLRLLLTAGLLSTWLALLLLGWSFHGAVYVLLVAALAVFPWRLLRAPLTEVEDDEGEAVDPPTSH
jgi:hypothetical protein